MIFVADVIGTFLTGVYAFRLYFIVFTGEPTAFAREHIHLHQGKEAPLSMRWPVAVLAVLAAIGGFLQFAPFWTPADRLARPGRRAARRADRTRRS